MSRVTNLSRAVSKPSITPIRCRRPPLHDVLCLSVDTPVFGPWPLHWAARGVIVAFGLLKITRGLWRMCKVMGVFPTVRQSESVDDTDTGRRIVSLQGPTMSFSRVMFF